MRSIQVITDESSQKSTPTLSPMSKAQGKAASRRRSTLTAQMYDFFIHSKEKDKDIQHTWVDPKVNDKPRIHNGRCEICARYVSMSRDVLQCIYCNVVCHRECVKTTQGMEKLLGASIDHLDDVNREWVCFYCHDSLQYDLKLHETATVAQQYRQLINDAQTIIAKYWRRFWQRKWYIRIYSCIVRMQIQFQVRKRKRVFLHNVQAKLRTVKIKVSQILQLYLLDKEAKVISPTLQQQQSSKSAKIKKREYTIYLIVTVYDLTQGTSVQTWRIESPLITIFIYPNSLADIILEEKFILGGVSGFQHIVISVFQKGTVRDIFLGQASIEMNIKSYWKKGGKFSLPLQTCGYELKDAAGMDLKADFRVRPQGSIDFELITSNGMNAEACSCYGSSVEEIIRALARLPDTIGFVIPVKKVVPGAGRINALAQLLKAGEGGPDGLISSDASVSSASHAGGSSVAGSSSVVTSTILDGPSSGMKKMWIAVAEGKLYLFGHFGDQLKLTIDIQYFSVSYEFLKGNNVMYKLYRMGYPEFNFYPVHEHESFRMKCAFLCSVRLAKGFAINPPQHNSEPKAQSHAEIKSQGRQHRLLSILRADSNSDLSASVANANSEKFDMGFLVSDLLALEIMKAQRRQLAKEASASFSSPLGASSSASFISKRGSHMVGPHRSNSNLINSPQARNVVQLSPIKRAQLRNSAEFLQKSHSISKPRSQDKHRVHHGRHPSPSRESYLMPSTSHDDQSVASQASTSSHNSVSSMSKKDSTKSKLNRSIKGSQSEFKVRSSVLSTTSNDSVTSSSPKKSKKHSKSSKRTSSIQDQPRASFAKSASMEEEEKEFTEKDIEHVVSNLACQFRRSSQSTKHHTEETREMIRAQILDELTMESVAADEKFQNVSDVFVKNLIAERTELKVAKLHK